MNIRQYLVEITETPCGQLTSFDEEISASPAFEAWFTIETSLLHVGVDTLVVGAIGRWTFAFRFNRNI
jgi:hypothetical protein